MKDKKTLIRYATTVALGLIMAGAVGYYCYNSLYTGKGLYYVYMALADGFFVPAALFICFGLLVMVANTGALDIIGFGFKSLIYLFTPYKKSRSEGGYYEYKVAQKAKRGANPYYVLWVGLGFLAVSVVFVVLNATV